MSASKSKHGLRWRFNRLFRALRYCLPSIKEIPEKEKSSHKLLEYSPQRSAVNGYTIRVNDQEATLINWVLTLQSYSPENIDYLMKPSILQVCNKAGKIIIQGAGELELLEEEVKWLLVILPVTFRLGRSDAGFSLKKKLYEVYLKNKA